MSDAALRFRPAPKEMTESAFVQRFGEIYEHTPSIATSVWRGGLDDTHSNLEGLLQALAVTVDRFEDSAKLDLINAHPDLAGRAALAGELTADSTAEQAGAGIDQCSAEEFARFQELNNRYKDKFGFTFVMAVKGSNRHQILAAFEQRLNNDTATEFERAILEIHKIARLRLRQIAAGDRQVTTGEDSNGN